MALGSIGLARTKAAEVCHRQRLSREKKKMLDGLSEASFSPRSSKITVFARGRTHARLYIRRSVSLRLDSS